MIEEEETLRAESCMDLVILFWNCNIAKGDLWEKEPPRSTGETLSDRAARHRDKASIVARLARHHSADILVLCECTIDEKILLEALKAEDSGYECPPNPHPRFKFFTRFPASELGAFHQDDRIAVRRFVRAGCPDILLAAFHYLDRMNHSPEKQLRDLGPFRQTLLDAERRAGHSRLALFGDFNMNPYDMGMLDAKLGLGALMTWELAEAHSELGEDSPHRFYNPMWALMGRPTAPGTHYWPKAEPSNPFWHCLDGIVLRPELRGIYSEGSACILATIPGPSGLEIDLYRLAEKHYHLRYSDHLPVLFRLTLPAVKEGDDAQA